MKRLLTAMGYAAGAAHDAAVGKVYQVYRTQAEVLGYSDVFRYTAIVAFAVVPFCFFLSRTKGGSRGASH